MRFEKKDPIWLDGNAGIVVAVVRADDDPRKCVPPGERFVWRGSLGERDETTYLVKIDGMANLRWSYRHAVVPRLPVPADGSGIAGRRRSVLEDARMLSTGTLSYLCGYRDYGRLSQVHQWFLQHVIAAEGSGARFENWIDAWRWFVNGKLGDEMPAYEPHERLYLVGMPGDALRDDQCLVRAPEGNVAIRVDSPVGTLDVVERSGALNVDGAALIRVGFVRRHWLGPKAQAMLDQWVMQRSSLARAA